MAHEENRVRVSGPALIAQGSKNIETKMTKPRSPFHRTLMRKRGGIFDIAADIHRSNDSSGHSVMTGQ